jgi:hypothetical protein
MLLKIDLKKSILSTWLLILFVITVVLSAGISQFFQAPKNVKAELAFYQNLFKPGEILSLKRLILKNSLGTFEFEKQDHNPESPWYIVSPRKLPANSAVLNELIKELESIKIKAVHPLDSINISNYSLDNPYLELSLINHENKSSDLTFGLINPIDNSTFVTLSGQKAIYHIDNIRNTYAKLELTKLVDTRIFTLTFKDVVKIEIFKLVNTKKRLNLSLVKNNNVWLGKNKLALDEKKIKKFVDQFSSIKTNIILDEVSEKQQEEITRYFKDPLYNITITTKSGRVHHYETSALVKKLSGLKLERWKNILFKAKEKNVVYILRKEKTKIFNQTAKKMKALPIKKLFY